MNRLNIFIFLFVALFPSFAHSQEIIGRHPLDNMPLVRASNAFSGFAPQEQRDEIFRKWLAPSVKIRVSGGSGSGTIVYYDRSKNIAYVASCGHLWGGNMDFSQGKNRNLTCKVITWYHNDEKLSSPKEYEAVVHFYSNHPNPDTSLLSFKPDWEPTYFPIAPVDHPVPSGKHVHSCGCDGGREVAHYDVVISGIEGNNLVTRQNSPRPGRSGGGLMDDKYYIATCWGTSAFDGTGNGFFTPLDKIHQVWTRNEHDWLLKIQPNILAREIPIVDRDGPQGTYPKDYIPLP